jgi:hypothetical protein
MSGLREFALYHEISDCKYDETPPEEWSKGLVGFKPTAVFDVSKTEDEPLPDLDTEAVGESTPSNANSTSDSTASRRSSNSLNRVTPHERRANDFSRKVSRRSTRSGRSSTGARARSSSCRSDYHSPD